MSQKSTEDLRAERLLAGRDELPAVEIDDIFERVDRTLTKPKSLRNRPWLWASVGVAACAGFLLLAVPDSSTYRTKGQSSAYQLVTACDTPSGRCRPGSRLLLRATAPQGVGFLSVFARRSDGTIIWYFPGQSSPKSLPLTGLTDDGLLATSVVLGDEHPVGSYELYAFFSDHPLATSTIREFVDAGEEDRDPSIRLLRKDLLVE